MATLINRIQRAMLGSSGPEKVRALLAELAIPTSGSGNTSIREVRRGFLRPISDEAILRDALANFGLAGGGGGDPWQALGDIRNAILRNLVDCDATLLQGLNDLLAPGDLAGGGGGGLDWVPEGAVIHIDFLGGTPQGRAWTADDGEVGIETLLGSDPNTENGWDITAYDELRITADGYVQYDEEVGGSPLAFIGAARTLLLGAATSSYSTVNLDATLQVAISSLLFLSADGNDALQLDVSNPDTTVYAWQGAASATISGVTNDEAPGARNVLAATVTASRLEAALNGSNAVALTLTSAERPAGNSLVAVVLDLRSSGKAIQSITIYDPLPDTTGLSELSEVDGGGAGAFASSSVSSRSISGGAI